MNIALLPNLTRENAPEITAQVCERLDALQTAYMLTPEDKRHFPRARAEVCGYQEMLERCDVLVTIGGDGTIIHAAKSAAQHGKPVLGINAGRLAFMAGLERNELGLLSNLISGQYGTDRRMLLKTKLMRGDEVLATRFCINDTVVSREGKMRLVELRVEYDGKHINNYMGDGIIVATPTGSTAYSLSAGGPVIDPELESILLTPICAHSLFARSFILKADSVLKITAKAGSAFAFSCDGEDQISIPPDGHLVIEKAELSAAFIRIKSDTFVDVLNSKLAQWRA